MCDTRLQAGSASRLGVTLLGFLAWAVIAPPLARAQGTPYTFTRIADTVQNDPGSVVSAV